MLAFELPAVEDLDDVAVKERGVDPRLAEEARDARRISVFQELHGDGAVRRHLTSRPNDAAPAFTEDALEAIPPRDDAADPQGA